MIRMPNVAKLVNIAKIMEIQRRLKLFSTKEFKGIVQDLHQFFKRPALSTRAISFNPPRARSV